MGDPACYLHLLDEHGRMPEPAAALLEAGDQDPEAAEPEAPGGGPDADGPPEAAGPTEPGPA